MKINLIIDIHTDDDLSEIDIDVLGEEIIEQLMRSDLGDNLEIEINDITLENIEWSGK